ncbi:DUF4145 domain-containing protein [Loktanella sp. S4079]|uniref:DUF4145 domain-containing protein n=1 Tax=Loktanella sp. S4079 TaxID=579483 RepID=UPI0005FA0B76|nr:DUF4145 domain-containing protein [Loktanella sp. S4079]KJZ20586.1 hypothetical protein TW80_07360 [Loktanella sp. S4079]
MFAYSDSKNALAASKPNTIYMFPARSKSFQIKTKSLGVPDALWRSMEGTVNAYNSRNYTATMSSGRRTLEGIFKYMVSSKDQNLTLFQLIKKVEEEVDLAAPLKRLSDAIRNGGNLGAHFDMEYEPDDTMARQLVELLDYLIEYLYSLPNKIEALENVIDPREDTSKTNG